MNFATSSPFGEFSLKKNYNFEFKPLPFKPIHFIKEIWSPFGIFGVKHGIEKRDLDKIVSAEEKGMLEHRLPIEIHEEEQLGPATFPRHELGIVPITNSPIGPNYLSQVKHVEIEPIPAPPPIEVVITPPPPKVEPIPGLHTNIVRDQFIESYLKEIGPEVHEEPLPHEEINSVERMPVPKMEEPGQNEASPFVRGTKLVLYFGNLLLDIMARFLGRPVAPAKE